MRRASARGWVGAFAVAAVAACTSGPPPGFSGAVGDRWTFPLVGPLEDGLLIAPVSFNVNGPYLFAIDPDAPVSLIDGELVKTLGLRGTTGPRRLDETDTQRRRAYVEALGIELGTLVVERRDMIVVAPHTFDVPGRRILGVIGRDVLADSLVFGFDRDRGLGHLVMQEAFAAPRGAIALAYEDVVSTVPNVEARPLPRHVVAASIGGRSVAMHLDLGATNSQLRAALWQPAQLVAREVETAVIDEVGTPRRVTRATEPAAATVASVTSKVSFVPYEEKRWRDEDVGGALGLGFFAPYAVWASWHTRTFHLVPRAPEPVARRIARWESAVLDRCKRPGCIEVRLIDPLAGQPPAPGRTHPGVILSITREEIAGGMDLEVALAVAGDPNGPYLIVNLPAHVDRLIHQLRPELAGAALEVVDASPFPRTCPGKNGCVDQIVR